MICPVCKTKNIPENSLFCNMCGVNLKDATQKHLAELEMDQRDGKAPLAEKVMNLGGRTKTIKVLCKDITQIDEQIDLLTISAFPYSYYPSTRSLIGALDRNLSISVAELAEDPLFDLRENAGCWISKEITENKIIKRIGGVEIPSMHTGSHMYERRLIKAIKAYMQLINILTEHEPDTKVVVLPLLGAGDLQLNHELLVFPLINEVIQLLTQNEYIEKVIFVEKDFAKAKLIADAINKSYNVHSETEEFEEIENSERNVFISYTEKGDREVADMLGNYLTEKGIPYWYAPRDITVGDYATEIVKGIKKCTHFICIVSKNSMKSAHVMNEVDLAFKRISEGIKIIPFRMDDAALDPAFEYYLSRMNWKMCSPPPVEKRIIELVDNCVAMP